MVLEKSDSCDTCCFNTISPEETTEKPQKPKDSVCEIRDIAIKSPFWTSCNNHPAKNPLLSKTPRGPLWAAVFFGLDSKPMTQRLIVPLEFKTPEGDGMSVRIPYYGDIRPIEEGSGMCDICGEWSLKIISLKLEKEKKYFCSVAHYLEWWLSASPDVLTSRTKIPLDDSSLRQMFGNILCQFPEATEDLQQEKHEKALKLLRSLDDRILELRYRNIGSKQALFPQHTNSLSPSMLNKLCSLLRSVQLNLSHVGVLLDKKDFSKEQFRSHFLKIQQILEEFLKV